MNPESASQVPFFYKLLNLLRCLFQHSVIMNPEPTTEKAIKALQAQNAQFRELFMSLAQRQQELKALLLKKKKNKRIVLFNIGRRLGNTLQNEAERTTPSVGEGSHQGREVPSPMVSDTETDFNDEQYPLLRTGTSN